MTSKPRELTEFGPWSEQKSSSGRKYFYNKDTEVSQWEKPKDWKDHELRLEQERLAAEQRTQPQPPPPPPMLFPPPFPPFSPNIPPPPGYLSFPMNTPPPFMPPPFAGAPFAPPPVPAVPPPAVPPPPARVNTNVPPPLVSNQPPPLSQPPKTQPASSQLTTSKPSAYVQKQTATGAGNPPPPPKQPSFMQQSSPMLLQQSPHQGSPMIQASTPQQQNSSSRFSQSPQTPVSSFDQKPEVKLHPYATPQPVKHLHAPSVQLTISSQPPPPPPPQLPAKETESSRTDAETASGKPVKREWDETASDSPKDHTQQTPVKKCKEECVEEEKVPKPEEPWRRFYDADLASKKKAELKLQEDPEMSDIVMQSLALENKLIAELIKVKQAAAMVAVQEHEVILCQGKIANLQEQQRTIEQRSQNTPALDLPDIDDLKRQFSQR